ncbi:MAG: DUF5906 domain-containing protein, partial [Gallionella sp.]
MIKNKRVLPLEKVKEVLSVLEIQAITGVNNVYIWKNGVAQKHIDKLLIAMEAKAANATLEAAPAPIVDVGQPDVAPKQPVIETIVADALDLPADEPEVVTEVVDDATRRVSDGLAAVADVVAFTIFKSPDSLSKQYWLEDGIIHKKAAAQMHRGSAERVTMPFSELVNALSNATSNYAFGYGTHALSFPDKVNIAIKGKEKPEKNIISRSGDFIEYRTVPGLFMGDHDVSEFVRFMPWKTLLAALTQTCPGIASAARIVRGSVSAGVHLVDESPRDGKGYHFYMPVKNTTDIPRFGKLLFAHLWLNGHGTIALSRNGSMLVRSPIDDAVFSGERLDFVGKPIITGTGLQYTPPEIDYTEGDALDTLLLPDLTPEQTAQFEKLIAEAKEAIKPESEQKRKIWVSDKIKEMVANGVPSEKATDVINQILSGGCRDLYSDFILEFSTGTVSVADVLANPKQYDKQALADPVEGKEYGGTTAMFYWNNGKPVINSLAHGQSTRYFLHQSVSSNGNDDADDWQSKYDALVDVWNGNHASVVVGRKHKILRGVDAESAIDGRAYYEFFDKKDLSLLHDNTRIQTGINKSGEPVFKNHLMAWASHPKARTYTGGVTFWPGRIAPAEYFNTWRGFSVEPKQNDELLNPILCHIRNVVCAGHTDLYEYLIKWIAYTIQHPDKPAGAAIVLRGEKGSGKGTLGHFLRAIWGNHGLHISNAKHLVGNFNGHLVDTCFLFADEAFYSGDKQHEGVLKALVTEPTIIVERKGIDAIA